MICPICGKDIKVNGVGSLSSPFNRVITFLLHILFPATCALFDHAAKLHDLKYHMRGCPKLRADREFLRDMLVATKELKVGKFWFRYQAHLFYLAVRVGGQTSFEEAKKGCR